MKTFHIYTDVSYQPLKNYVSHAAVIVSDSHIMHVLFKERQLKHINCSVNYYERTTMIWAIKFVIKHYKCNNIICYCDNKNAVNKNYKEYKFKWVKGHTQRRTFKYRFNDLADYISKNGLNNWKEYWLNKLLER